MLLFAAGADVVLLLSVAVVLLAPPRLCMHVQAQPGRF
jgi:hypothetical protein